MTRGPALGVLEIATIARGVVVSDAGLKRSPAVLLHARAVSGGKVIADQWAHVACVVDGTRVHVYLDGIALAASTGSILSNPTLSAALGGNAPSGEPFVGAIDSFRMFRVARTTAEIAAAAGK